jgi:hypothetical protein
MQVVAFDFPPVQGTLLRISAKPMGTELKTRREWVPFGCEIMHTSWSDLETALRSRKLEFAGKVVVWPEESS